MTDEEEDFKKHIVCRLCEKRGNYNKIRDHCHSTGKGRGPADLKCKIYITQNKAILFLLSFKISVNMLSSFH